MRKSTKVLSVAVALASMNALSGHARAVDYLWTDTAVGVQAWDNPANWTPTGFPALSGDKADLSVGLSADLGVTLAAPQTVSTLVMGGATTPVTTTIGDATGGALILAGTTSVLSKGISGSTNVIAAPVVLQANLVFDATSTNALTLATRIQADAGNRTISNASPGAVLRLGTGSAFEIRTYDATDATVARTITFSGVAGSVTEINGTFVKGPSNVGNVSFDTGSGATFATYVINAPQTFSGGLQRGTYVANDNLAFGPGTLTAAAAGTLTVTGTFTTGNGNQATWNGTITSTKTGGVTIPNLIILGNSNAFAGSENIVLSGALTQGNNRAMGNAMSAGATLTLTPDPVTNPTGISIGISRVVGDGTRTWIVEGTGTTIINGMVVNNLTDDTSTSINGNFEKRGSGRVELNNAFNTMRGAINARGGTLVFGAAGAWGNTSGINAQVNGGIWFTPGVGDAGWDSFTAKILNTSIGFFAVPASAASSNFDFSTGNLNANAKSMGIGADGNVTFAGTVTPDPVVGYNWGGNTGTLTLGADASVGAVPVTYKNGGTVKLAGTQAYTGVTTINGANMVTSQAGILTKSLPSTATNNVFTATVLEVSTLGNAGAPSSLGASAADAANLVIAGGTLRYTGATNASTDRLFTVGTGGATIEVGGTGSVAFGSAGGANGIAGTAARTLTLTGTNAGVNTLGGDLSNGTATLSIAKAGTNAWNLTGTNTFTGGVTVNGGTLGVKKVNANGNVIVNAGAKLQLGPGSAIGDASLFGETANTLTLNGTGTLDVNKAGAVFDYDVNSPEATILARIVTGRAGNWTGTGITSAAAAASPSGAVGYVAGADASPSFGGVFLGQAFDATSVLVRYTLSGDATLDGTVNFDDLLKLAANYNSPGKWSTGDFNYDGTVNFDDLLSLAANYNATVTGSLDGDWALAQSVVPEPTSLATLGAIGPIALRRRRRQAK